MHALALADQLVSTAGSWSLEHGAARFTPAFRPVPGTVHAVVAQGALGAPWRELTRAGVPVVELVPRTRVQCIDPGADRVPANLLRISVTFSGPMEEGSAAGRVHLRADDGTELTDTLLPMPPELWDRPRRRLTVLLEPGRIKRGLQPNVQAGPPLTPGRWVTFHVDSQVRDAAGAPLVAGSERTYRVVEPIRTRVDPKMWELRWPEPDDGRLVVRFGRSLDRALVRRCLRVTDVGGAVVPGNAVLDLHASTWTFTPAVPAVAGWRLHVDADLEDLAGNSVRRAFDRDLAEPDHSVPPSVVTLTRR